MNPIQKTKQTFNREILRLAEANIERKLLKQGIDPAQLGTDEYDELVRSEIAILKSDTKKVGAGIGIGLLISALTGF